LKEEEASGEKNTRG